MLKLSNLKSYKGATKRRKVIGRGLGSGHGTYSGRGAKGQKARAGASIPIGFEGGRMPLHRQIPKRRGFTSHNPQAVAVNLEQIDKKFEKGETVNPKIIFNKGLTKSKDELVKILGQGQLTKSLTFENLLISAQALEKIAAAGGKVVNKESGSSRRRVREGISRRPVR